MATKHLHETQRRPANPASIGREDAPRAERLEAALARLRRAGFKVTPQRASIVSTFLDDPTHPTAQDLFARLRQTMPMMSFATVYNTLDALSNAGLSVARTLTRGSTRFDPNVDPHDHAVCDRCGAVMDVVAAPALDPTAVTPMRRHPAPESRPIQEPGGGFEVHAVERVYRGICAACAEPKRTSNRPDGQQTKRTKPTRSARADRAGR